LQPYCEEKVQINTGWQLGLIVDNSYERKGPALKNGKWVRWNVIKLLIEMMASVSLENRVQRGPLPS
jgi:hypothetical protein